MRELGATSGAVSGVHQNAMPAWTLKQSACSVCGVPPVAAVVLLRLTVELHASTPGLSPAAAVIVAPPEPVVVARG